MGVPPEMEVRFHSAAEAAPLLDVYRTEPHPGILLTGDIATMHELVLHGGVREVNIGGIHHRAGRRQYLRYVFLTADEQRALRDVAALGALVTAQDVPAARAIPLEEMLTEAEVS
jgi:PTS system mannose-specific IIB component/fructoselysine and glucoselysine-specific PTS system IIB component